MLVCGLNFGFLFGICCLVLEIFMITVIIFIIILGVLIFVHELGHFLVARRNGIRAEEFGFGFPPRIIGVQTWREKELEKIAEEEKIDVKVQDIVSEEGEIIKETITDEKKEIDVISSKRKWRWVWGRQDASEDNPQHGTVYSLNWIPLGGFVKIKGEDGENKDKDSFASKGAWTRTKVLAAGVIMNFVLAWILISFCLMIGIPEPVEEGTTRSDSKIQISEIIPDSPAKQMGIKIGDEILKEQVSVSGEKIQIANIEKLQEYINANKGKEITLQIKRGDEILKLQGTPRTDYPENQGPLGIAMAETAIYKYPWYQSFWKGLLILFDLIVAMLVALYGIIKSLLYGKTVGIEVAGPVGIAVLTKQATELGLVYILQFVAILSINLGIINALPFPALDGGRILFIIIEKIKRSPVSQKTEQAFHAIGFALLIILMLVITFRDILNVIK